MTVTWIVFYSCVKCRAVVNPLPNDPVETCPVCHDRLVYLGRVALVR